MLTPVLRFHLKLYPPSFFQMEAIEKNSYPWLTALAVLFRDCIPLHKISPRLFKV